MIRIALVDDVLFSLGVVHAHGPQPFAWRVHVAKIGRLNAERIFSRDGFKCVSCGATPPPYYDVAQSFHDRTKPDCLVVDHKNPGQGSKDDNLQTLCWTCNSSKAGRSHQSFELAQAIKILGRPIAFYPSIARVFGIKESLFFCQLIYWTPRGRNDKGDGWIYKSAEEMECETGLTYKEQQGIRDSLCSVGMLEEKYDRPTHRLYFRINLQCLNRVLALHDLSYGCHVTESNVAPDKKSFRETTKGKFGIPEITTEITTEINTRSQTPLADSPIERMRRTKEKNERLARELNSRIEANVGSREPLRLPRSLAKCDPRIQAEILALAKRKRMP